MQNTEKRLGIGAWIYLQVSDGHGVSFTTQGVTPVLGALLGDTSDPCPGGNWCQWVKHLCLTGQESLTHSLSCFSPAGCCRTLRCSWGQPTRASQKLWTLILIAWWALLSLSRQAPSLSLSGVALAAQALWAVCDSSRVRQCQMYQFCSRNQHRL